MPNKRSDEKNYLSAWIDADLKDQLRSIAKQRGVSMSEVVESVLKEEIAQYKTKNEGDNNG